MDKVIFENWRRSVGWKCDIVRASYRRGMIHDYAVDVLVLFPVGETGLVELALDGRMVDYVSGKRIPAFFSTFLASPDGWRIGRYVQRVVDAVGSALPWFDQFATPESCERMLLEGKTAYLKASKTTQFQGCLEYLRRIRGAEARDK